MDLQSILGDGGIVGVFLYLLFRDLIRPKYNKAKFKKPEYNRRSTDRLNPNDKPGQTGICRDNRDRIIKLEEGFKNFKDDVKEECKDLKTDVKKLFGLWDKLILKIKKINNSE